MSCFVNHTSESTDFEKMELTLLNNLTLIRINATDDNIALEYDDMVKLRFIPDLPVLIEDIGYHQFIQDTAMVNIIDDDSK